MASEFATLPLKEYCVRITKGTTPTTLDRPFVKEGINFVKSEAITPDGHIDSSTFAFIDDETHKTLSRSILQEGDVLFSMAGVYLGKTAVVPPSILPANTNQAVGIIRLDQAKASPRYVHYVLSSPALRSFVRRSVAQSAQPNFNLGDIGNLPIPNLPIRDQHAIARILGTLDDKIELNRSLNKTLEEIARALFKSWFVNFDPVCAKVEGANAAIPEQLTDLFPNSFSDSKIERIPQGWLVGELGDVLTAIETGGRPKGGVRDITTGVPSVGAESIVGIGHFDYSKTKFVPREFFDSMSKGHVQPLDVLLYKDGGRPGVYEPHLTIVGDGFPFTEFCINEHVYRLRTEPRLPQVYLFFWLTSEAAMDEMRTRGTGVAIPGLNSTAVRGLSVLEPSLPVLDAYGNYALPIVKKIFCNCNESRTLATLRDALLPKLISGELRVRDAEHIVGVQV